MEYELEEEKKSEISIVEIIELSKEYGYEVIRKIWIVLLLGIIIGAYLYTKESNEKTMYTSSLTFTQNKPSSSSGGISSIIGQFGLESEESGGATKMLEMLYSRKVLKKALFRKIKIDEKEDFVINHYLDFSFREKWKDTPRKDFYFTSDSIDPLNRDENGVLLAVIRRIKVLHLTHEISPGEIILLKFECESEEFSFNFINILYNELKGYYIDESINKQLETYNMLQVRTDSLEKEYRSIEYRLAHFQDTNKGIFKRTSMVQESELIRTVSFLSALYNESLRSTESARFALINQTPFLQELDLPIYPLSSESPRPIYQGILGLLAGMFLGISIVLGLKYLKDKMGDNLGKTEIETTNDFA